VFAELLARLGRGLDAAGLPYMVIGVHKVLAGRPRDLEDVRGVLRKTLGLDAARVRAALRELGEAIAEPLVERFDALVADEPRRG